MSRRRRAGMLRPPMSDRQHAAVTHELVRLTLGGRPDRPELVAPLIDPTSRRRRKRAPILP